MGVLALIDPAVLAVFTLAALIASVGAVFLSGFFPLDARPAATRGAIGGAMIWLGVAMTATLTFAAVSTAFEQLPWAVAVVAAGLAFLAAPFLVQPMPQALRDSKIGLGFFIGLAAASLYAFCAVGAL